MGKFISVTVAIVLQLLIVIAFHIHFTNNPRKVVIVVESSYGLTTYQNKIVDTIEMLEADSKYKVFHYGTDKTYLGRDANIDSLFRVTFGKMDMNKLERLYPDNKYDTRYLLIFTDADAPNGWEAINIK